MTPTRETRTSLLAAQGVMQAFVQQGLAVDAPMVLELVTEALTLLDERDAAVAMLREVFWSEEEPEVDEGYREFCHTRPSAGTHFGRPYKAEPHRPDCLFLKARAFLTNLAPPPPPAVP